MLPTTVEEAHVQPTRPQTVQLASIGSVVELIPLYPRPPLSLSTVSRLDDLKCNAVSTSGCPSSLTNHNVTNRIDTDTGSVEDDCQLWEGSGEAQAEGEKFEAAWQQTSRS